MKRLRTSERDADRDADHDRKGEARRVGRERPPSSPDSVPDAQAVAKGRKRGRRRRDAVVEIEQANARARQPGDEQDEEPAGEICPSDAASGQLALRSTLRSYGRHGAEANLPVGRPASAMS